MALAAIMIVAAGAIYLRPATTAEPHTTQVTTVDPSLVSLNPVDYAFVTPSMGWAAMVLAGLSSATVEFRIFRTIDGAKHWQQQLAGESNRGLGFLPITVQMFGKAIGFMTVGQPIEELYRTADGGEHWDPLVLPPLRVDAIRFTGPTSAWLVSYTGAGIPEQITCLYKTSDSGQTWQRLPDPPADATDPAFRSPAEAWMASLDPRLPHVYTSSDGGYTWRRHDLPQLVGSLTDDSYSTRIQLLPGSGAVASVEALRCTVVLPLCGTSVSKTFLVASIDLGATWRQLPFPPGQVAYQDSVHWWAMSTNAVFKSADAGRSWVRAATIPPNLQFSVLSILDSRHAWASLFVMGGYGLALSGDGGLHWTLARVPAPT
jgi:photosystem II stability/assembly factor-like uncharacterized protein